MNILTKIVQLFFKAKSSKRYIEKIGFYDEAMDSLHKYDKNWRNSDFDELIQCKNMMNLFWNSFKK